MFPEEIGPIALELVAALEAAKIPCAIGGAIALGVWAIPRGTHDVDLNAFVGPERYDELLDVLARTGCRFDRDEALRRAREGEVVVAEKGGYRIDVFVPSIPFDVESERRVQRIAESGRTVPLLSAEALCVYKLLFFRNKDFVDLEALVSTRRSLDSKWVRAQLVDMLGEDSDRVEKWDEIVRTFGQPSA